MKTCKICHKRKDEKEYYPHRTNRDGLDSYCKSCKIILSREQRKKIKFYPENYWNGNYHTDWSKYYTKRKVLRMQYPEKSLAQTACRNIETREGYDKHHWSYNEEHWLDVVYLTKSVHRFTHRHMIYDQEQMMFRKLDGLLLDTKEAHLKYIEEIMKAY